MEKNPTELVNDNMASGIRYSQKLDGMVGSARKGRKGKHGGAWYDDAWNSITNEFTNPQSYLQQGLGQIGNEFTNPESYLAQGVGQLGNEFTDKDSLLRGQYLGQAADGVSKAAPIIDILAEQMGLGKGVGKTMADVLKGAQEVNKAASSVGLGRPTNRDAQVMRGWGKGGRVYTSPYGRPYDRPVKGGQKGALDYVSEFVPESREGIKAAKTYAPLLKMLLKGEAPQYSAQIDQGAKMLGLGKKKGKRGGNWWDVFTSVPQQMAAQISQPIGMKQNSPIQLMAEQAKMAAVNNPLGKVGGRRKKGGFLDFGALGRDIENAFRPVGEAFTSAPQLIAQPVQMGPYMKQSYDEIRKVGGRKPSARNEVVKRVMAERGCSLPEASSIVKREGLY